MSDQTFTIKSPNPDYSSTNSSVEFRRGVGYTDDPVLAARFRERGYQVTEGGKGHDARPPQSVEPHTVAAPTSRDAAVLGADAAGPRSDAFLPPVGAGEGKDPHGEEVVSPGIHAVPPAPITPGEVSRDPEAQQAKESEAAKAVLIDGESVEDNSGPDFKEPEGPLHLSDPASVGKGPDAAAAPEKPKANASRDDWANYAVSQGVPREEVENLGRAGIIERVGK